MRERGEGEKKEKKRKLKDDKWERITVWGEAGVCKKQWKERKDHTDIWMASCETNQKKKNTFHKHSNTNTQL